MNRLVFLTVLSCVLVSPAFADDGGFVKLFNGKDLTGWTQRNGTATYRVEDKAIVGKTAEGTPIRFFAATSCTATSN